jgi:hypothetical protein
MNDLIIIGIAILTASIVGTMIVAFDDDSSTPRGRKPTRRK